MKIETLLFKPLAAAAISDDLAQKLAAAEDAIYRLYKAGHPVYYGYSGGKDSGLITDIGFRAARRFKAEGGNPISVVGTSNTRVACANHTKMDRPFQRETTAQLQFYLSMFLRLKMDVSVEVCPFSLSTSLPATMEDTSCHCSDSCQPSQ